MFRCTLLETQLRRQCLHIKKRCLVTSGIILSYRNKDETSDLNKSTMNDPDTFTSKIKNLIPMEGSNVDTIAILSKKRDFSLKGFANYVKKANYDIMKKDQQYEHERVEALGVELAAAHFIIFRDGRIRFKGSPDWISSGDKNLQEKLPYSRVPGYFVDGIDFGKAEILYNGIECIRDIDCVRSISFSHSPTCDDWIMDSIAGSFCDKLEHLDISYCSHVSDRGIACIARMRNLKTVNLEGLSHIKNLKLLRILLEESLPNLIVNGADLKGKHMSFDETVTLSEDILEDESNKEINSLTKEKVKESV